MFFNQNLKQNFQQQQKKKKKSASIVLKQDTHKRLKRTLLLSAQFKT